MDVLLFGGFHLENKTWLLAVGGNVGIPLEAVTITARLTLIIWSRAEQGPTSRHYIPHPHTHTAPLPLTSTCPGNRQIRDKNVVNIVSSFLLLLTEACVRL